MKLASLCLGLLLAGCASVGPIDKASLPKVPAAFKEGSAKTQRADGRVPDALPADGEWWKVFADPTLDQLERRALASNNSIDAAAARLAQARAIARITDARRAPQVAAGGGAMRQLDISTGPKPLTVGRVAADFSYEVDLFGKLSEASRASSLDADARASLLASTRLLVQAEVAQSYLTLRALDAERALVRSTVVAYRDSLAHTQRRFAAGDISELDVARVQVEVSSTESDAIALDRRRAEVEHALAVLLGEAPSSFALVQEDWATRLPVIPAGVPSSVLQRRPDVAAAEKSVYATQARVGVAKSAWFPNISLTGSAGFASTDLADVFMWSARQWGIGMLLSLPLLDGGRRSAEVERTSAELDGTLAAYRDQVLVAFREVEDQLSGLEFLAQQAEAQRLAVDAATRATTLSDNRYRAGYVSQLDLLDAQRSELRNRRQALQVRSAQFQSTVGLVRALGGGW